MLQIMIFDVLEEICFTNKNNKLSTKMNLNLIETLGSSFYDAIFPFIANCFSTDN